MPTPMLQENHRYHREKSMEPLAKNLPTQNDLTARLTQGQKPLSPALNREKIDLLRSLVQQSFDIFNIYGKQPEAVANILQGFGLALADQEITDIRKAFTIWLKTKSAMPTPSDIRDLCLEETKHRSQLTRYSDMGQDYTPPQKNPTQPISWAMKHWKEFTPSDKHRLEIHLNDLGPEERAGYLSYLHTMCGMPKAA